MKASTSLAVPRSFADALTDIRLLRQRAATAIKVLLRTHGWRHTCLNPAHRWLWAKKFPDGRTLLTDLDTALAIEAALARQTLPSPDPAAASQPPVAAPPHHRPRSPSDPRHSHAV